MLAFHAETEKFADWHGGKDPYRDHSLDNILSTRQVKNLRKLIMTLEITTMRNRTPYSVLQQKQMNDQNKKANYVFSMFCQVAPCKIQRK